MAAKPVAKAGAAPAVCGVGAQGFKCAIVSWVAPLVAAGVLVAGLRYPVVSGFNILAMAFGITATVRSLAHIRQFGSCGLGGHVTAGVLLNLAVIALVVIYLFTTLDPFGLRP
jgi:hypothetical protein